MDAQARAAFIISQSACMQAELAAMEERNRTARRSGARPSHGPADFEALPDRYGLGHNSVVTYLMG